MASASQNPKNNNQKIIFKCDQHSAIISKKLQNFYLENEFFDTDLIAGDGDDSVVIQAHKIVLCASSEYFLNVFRSSQSNLNANIVELKEIATSTLKLVVDFMYSGCIELSLETVEEILRTASFLKIKNLIDGCCELILKNINSINCLKNFQLAKELGLLKLKSKALECTYTHFEEISKKKEILTLSENELVDLLFKDNLHGDIEEYVFLSMVAWVNYDKTNREHLVFKLLTMVRYWALTPKFIIENRKSVCKTIESYELICSWLQWHLSPETRSKNERSFRFKSRKMPSKLAITRLTNNNKITVETFNSNLNSWTTEIESSLSTKRYDCSITTTVDGKPIVVGGNDFSHWLRKAEYLDTQNMKWIDLPAMEYIRKRCQLIPLKEYFCVFGGDINNSTSLEIYNFSTKKWSTLKPPSQPSQASQITAHNDMLYILDFENGLLQCYDLSKNKWTTKIVAKDYTRNFGFSAVEGFLYVIGGQVHGLGQILKKVKRYDLSNGSWCEMASLQQPCSSMKTTVLENKKIIIIGSSFQVEEYNLKTNTWNTMRTLMKDDVSDIYNISTICV